MKIVAVIAEPDVIDAILRHLARTVGRDPFEGRAPPASRGGGDGFQPLASWRTDGRNASVGHAIPCPVTPGAGHLNRTAFLEAPRRYVGTLPTEHTGWLAGIHDPAVVRVLALLHERPDAPWTRGRKQETGSGKSAN